MVQTNYIGAFVLTNILLPLLKNSPVPSRVVNVTSFTHRCGKHGYIFISLDPSLESSYILADEVQGNFGNGYLFMSLITVLCSETMQFSTVTFSASSVDVPKETLAGKNLCFLPASKPYPFAWTYEYSKCTFILKS